MTLNDVVAVILRYFAEFGRLAFVANYVKVKVATNIIFSRCHNEHQLSTTDALCSSR